MRVGVREYLLSKAPSGIMSLSPGAVLLGLREPNAQETNYAQKILDILDDQAVLLMDGDAKLEPAAKLVAKMLQAELVGASPESGTAGFLAAAELTEPSILKLLEDWRTEATRTRPYYLSLPVWPEFAVPNNKVDGLLPSCRVESWTHFVDVMRNREHNRAKLEMVYRGQRGFSWPLSPTLARKFPNGVIREGDRDQLLENFRLAMRGRGPDFTATDETEIWAYGQHVGLATPLLDWSKSPFVSLYFAFSEADDDGEDNPSRAIYCLDLTRLKAELPQLFVEPKSNDNARLVNQAGLFTLTPAGRENLETYIINALQDSSAIDFDGFVDNPTEDDGFEFPADDTAKRLSSYLCKIHIPNRDREECLAMLRKMNIHHGSLFPDPFGAAQYCNDWLQRSIREDEEEAQLRKRQEEADKKAEQERKKADQSKVAEMLPPSPSDTPIRERISNLLKHTFESANIDADPNDISEKVMKNYLENESIDWVLKDSSKARIRTEISRQLGLLIGAGVNGKKLAQDLTNIFEEEYRAKNILDFEKKTQTSFFKVSQ
ncbi:FRG domain-containing protein [Thioclava litoralis]|uniref:FRG domain-containing protein n=1 Tax=Thioclava litoralis TaxID=3076557 RepID=A0ABZ1E210_9RHOB|nr:FRG domain-containing protein [Thioclava sp. FTW29]